MSQGWVRKRSPCLTISGRTTSCWRYAARKGDAVMRAWRNSLVVGIGLVAFSGFSMAAGPVTENFNDNPATDADASTNWVNVGGNYNFQAAGNNTGLVAPPGGAATGSGEAGGSS